MFRSRQRMIGRTWLTELCARVVRQMFSDGSTLGVGYLRAVMDGAGTSMSPKLQITITQLDIAGIPCLITTPNNSKPSSPVLIYFHGGGFVAGSPEGYQNLISLIAEQSTAVVIAADYRLSPEHVFPASQDDCLAVSLQILAEYPNQSVLLGGDSAGANLAINTALALSGLASQHSGNRGADGLVLISPWVEPTANGGSIVSNQGNDIFDPIFLLKSYSDHMGQADLFDPRANFINTDLSPLPKTYIQCGGGEQFVDQIQAFEGRAKSMDVDIELDIFDTQFHDFQTLWPVLKEGKLATIQLAEFIKSFSLTGPGHA
jgi:monoterpene epsilon-lactone hydrolase